MTPCNDQKHSQIWMHNLQNEILQVEKSVIEDKRRILGQIPEVIALDENIGARGSICTKI
jgi:hypothetical protein